MVPKKSQPQRIDKSALSVVHEFGNSDERTFWKLQSHERRMQQVELLRRINYGNKATGRLQRILEIVKRD